MDFKTKNPLMNAALFCARGAIERILLLNQLGKIYSSIETREPINQFVLNVLESLKVHYSVTEKDLSHIPKEGPTIVVSNHPFGGIDGIILSSILLSVRPDVKVMANFMLSRIPELHDIFIFVDPFGRKSSIRNNIKPMKETIRWVKNGSMAAIFPAGEVSHIKLHTRKIVDPIWSDRVAQIIRRTEAAVVPSYFAGFNSTLFQILGLVHPRLRTVMLPREVLNKGNKTLEVRIGQPIPFDKLSRFETDGEMMRYLRMRTYMLKNRTNGRADMKKIFTNKPLSITAKSVVSGGEPNSIKEEIRRLPEEQLLIDTPKFSAYHAGAKQIPHTLREIGRLREITFRQVGEGTGKDIDTDVYDEYYEHLFLWSKDDEEIVGAYRLGLADRILREKGKQGLYTHELFEFSSRFLNQLTNAVELGRSFVQEKYQKNYQSLMLLWKGIGAFIQRRPQYHILFGPVSISSEYNVASRHLIVSFLRMNMQRTDLSRHVSPRTPLRKKSFRRREIKAALTLLQNIRELSEMVSEIEGDDKGIPILLKQYIKLGGKFLGFNVDHNFSDALDALIFVDLLETEKRILERYMGRKEAESFLEHHSEKDLPHCA